MNIDKCREAFEAWVIANGVSPELAPNHTWREWQAAWTACEASMAASPESMHDIIAAAELRGYRRRQEEDAASQDDARDAALERDAISRAYGYLWHVNHPQDIPLGHPYVTADRAAYEGRKELRDLLTHEQRGTGINWVRQKLLKEAIAAQAAPAAQDRR